MYVVNSLTFTTQESKHGVSKLRKLQLLGEVCSHSVLSPVYMHHLLTQTPPRTPLSPKFLFDSTLVCVFVKAR